MASVYFDTNLLPYETLTTGFSEDYVHDQAQRLTEVHRANDVASYMVFDPDDRIVDVDHEGSTALYYAHYYLDPTGNPTAKRDLVDSTLSEFYSHDARGRLRTFDRGTLSTPGTAITTTLVDPELPGGETWDSLDRRGNWLDSSTTLNGTTTPQTRTRNSVNEYLTLDPDGSGSASAVTLTHDLNGNLTGDPAAPNAGGASAGQTYAYDEENRLTTVTRTSDSQVLLEIAYDAFGRRIESTTHIDPATGTALSTPKTTRHIMLGAETLEEHDIVTGGSGTTDTLERQFVWQGAFPSPVGMIDYTSAGSVTVSGTAEVFYFLRDRLGSVVAIADDSGAVVERYHYDPYGRTHIYSGSGSVLAASALGNVFMWTGQRYDAQTRLYHFTFRCVSGHLGQWFQRDPFDYVDNPNLHLYVQDHPLYSADPLGLWDGNPLCPLAPPEDVIYPYNKLLELLQRYSPIRGVWIGAGVETPKSLPVGLTAFVYGDANLDGSELGVDVFLTFGRKKWIGIGWQKVSGGPWYGQFEGVFAGNEHYFGGVGPGGGQIAGGTSFGKIGAGFVGVDIGLPPGIGNLLPVAPPGVGNLPETDNPFMLPDPTYGR